jgi:hypothetical protein
MDQPIRLRDNETAVVAYGSLLSVSSISKTLGHVYDGPFVACHIEGWRRCWDAAMPNQAFYYVGNGKRIYPDKILYLNVRARPGALMNCVVFVVTREQLEAMHKREWIYEPTDVNSCLRGVRIERGNAIMYVGRRENLLRAGADPRTTAVRASYLRMLEHALERVDASFREDYRRTTDPVPEHLVIDDVLDPGRPSPWASAGHGYDPKAQLSD